jgi:hypothetical protein
MGICFFGWMLATNAQANQGFQPVALHLAPGNLSVLEYLGTPIAKGAAVIELPMGLIPERVFWTHKASKTLKPTLSAHQGHASTVFIHTLRDSVRRMRPAADFGSLIAMNIGRQVSVETFDGSENVGYSGIILGIDQKAEVLILSAGQEIQNIPVRQIMYWSANSEWKHAVEHKEPSRYRVQLLAPSGWDAGPIQVWVETKSLDCAYTYRLKPSSKARLALDVRLQASFSFDEFQLVGHPSLNGLFLDANNAPLFRMTASGMSVPGVWSTTAREDEVSLLVKEDWNFSAVSVSDSQFFQRPSTRSRLIIRANSDSVEFMKIPLRIESDHQPPSAMCLIDTPSFDRELHVVLAKPVLSGADSGAIRWGRQMDDGNKPVGPEGWWVSGRIEADYSGSIPVEWTVHRSFLPALSEQSKQKFTVMDQKNMRVESGSLKRTIQITAENRYGLSYSYFLTSSMKGKK